MAEGYDMDNAYALIIGISNYKDPNIRKLNYTKADAEGILKILKDPRKVGLKQDNIKVMLDEEATLFNIKKAISGWLYKNADKESTVFVYFAGHGGVEEDRLGIEKDNWAKFLLAYDSEIDNLYSTSISNREFNDLLLTIRSKKLVIFMDSCYSGGVSESKARDVSVKITDDPYVKLAEGEGRLVIAASQPDQRSFEDEKLGHGVFTYHLIEALSGKADTNNDGYVTVTEVYNYLADKVPKSAMQHASAVQEPILRGNIKKDFVLSTDRDKIEELDQANEKNKQIEELRSSGAKLSNEGKYIEAIIKWKEVLKIDPENEIAKDGIKKAETHRKNKDLDRLLDWFSHGDLNDEQYELACRLRESSPNGLCEDDAKVKKLLDGLLSDKISITRFRNDLDRINGMEKPAIPEPEVGDFEIKIQEEPKHTAQKGAERLEQEHIDREARQAKLSARYSKGMDALAAQDWQTAIKHFNDLLSLDAGYKDTSDKLKEAAQKLELAEKRERQPLEVQEKANVLKDELEGLYIKGKRAAFYRDWEVAIAALQKVVTLDSQYQDASIILADAEGEFKKKKDRKEKEERKYREKRLEKERIDIEREAKFKTTTSSVKYCYNCGYPNDDKMNFCTQCCAKLRLA